MQLLFNGLSNGALIEFFSMGVSRRVSAVVAVACPVAERGRSVFPWRELELT